MKEMKQVIIKVYLAALLILVPLYYENAYFNTLQAKARSFWVVSGLVFACFISILIIEVLMKEPLFQRAKAFFKSFNLMDIAVFAFGLVAIISCIFSENRVEAFSGSNGWYMGAWTLFAYMISYFLISRNQPYDSYFFVFVTIGATLLFSLGFLNGFDIDPLGMHSLLIEKEHFQYISTVGNINSYSGYLSLLLPVLAMVYTVEDRKWLKRWVGIILVIGYANLFFNNSDGAFIGTGFGLLFFIYYGVKTREYHSGVLMNGIFFALGSLIVKLCDLFYSADHHTEFAGIGEVILDYWIFLGIGLLCLALILLKPLLVKITSEKSDKALSLVVGTISVILVLVIILYNAMHFSGEWGTKRGWIWMISIDMFKSMNPLQKLIGIGPDTFGILASSGWGDFISEHWGKRVANAHNEFLEYLITTGLVGAASYALFYLSAFRDYVKRIDWHPVKAILFFGIMGYMGQGLVNNPQAMNMAIFFSFLAVFRSFSFREEEKEVVYTRAIDKRSKSKKKKHRR